MNELEFFKSLVIPNSTKIVLLVMDGLGGLPREAGGSTELESARKPNFNALAARAALGLADPVGAGITPGSGPGHLGLFGYDPFKYEIGRGVLEALGIDFDLAPDDVAARGNFATADAQGNLTDRRAGRISTEKNQELVSLLRTIALPGVKVFVETVKEHRFVLVLRGENLGDDLTDTDPGRLSVPPLPVVARSAASERTATLVNEFVSQAENLLADKHPANRILLRGFAKRPSLPTLQETYGLRSASIAVYPMYRGVSKLVGMTTLMVEGETIEAEFSTLERNWGAFDLFYLHVKKTDSAGEDGDFDRKVHVIEDVDANIPRLLALNPDVVVVTGDHSTPAVLKAHSWHPVPVLLYSRFARAGGSTEFGETACSHGTLGRFPAKELMPLLVAHALRFGKFGA
jgi:2,3-bisphosphoglycerate-independent phosphoglycerate mutase